MVAIALALPDSNITALDVSDNSLTVIGAMALAEAIQVGGRTP